MHLPSVHTRNRLLFLRDSIRGVLTGLRCVKGVALFGSFASDRWDEWSDIDLLVACNNPAHDAAVLVAEMNAQLPICCHRPFSAKETPNGRYWFRNHSPCHKLDVSFHDQPDWHRALDDHRQESSPIRVLDCRGSSNAGDAPVFVWKYTPRQNNLFDMLHRLHRYLLSYARSGDDLEMLASALAAISQFMDEHPPENVYEQQAWEVAETMASLAETTTRPVAPGNTLTRAIALNAGSQ